jgi:choline dehydrogenase-like flavoprotein
MTHPADLGVLAAGVKFLDACAKSKHLSEKLTKRVFPDETMDLSDTAQAKEAIHDLVLSEYHPIGSCAMGDVVNSKLRVNGVKNLRVADASVFPNHVSVSRAPGFNSVRRASADEMYTATG